MCSNDGGEWRAVISIAVLRLSGIIRGASVAKNAKLPTNDRPMIPLGYRSAMSNLRLVRLSSRRSAGLLFLVVLSTVIRHVTQAEPVDQEGDKRDQL